MGDTFNIYYTVIYFERLYASKLFCENLMGLLVTVFNIEQKNKKKQFIVRGPTLIFNFFYNTSKVKISAFYGL